MTRHEDQSVIVTGGASGIGRGIAKRFGEEGANVVVADVRREPKQGTHFPEESTVPTDKYILAETPGNSTYYETDVSDVDDVKALMEWTADQYGSIDVLVNNAGVQILGDSQSQSVEEWRKVLGVDLDGAFYCTKFAVPHLREANGQLINISSVQASAGGGGPAYSSAKAGIVNLTRDLAVELAPDVRVNAICPGFIKTPIADYLDEDGIDLAKEQTLLDRLGEPEDIGDMAVFLASDAAEFVHGSIVTVDGGWSAHRI
jgi:NAD(P)-dependent dehydrogenase (short-subunit alcohol dehydrogenase family)